MRVMTIVGTRPELIRLSTIIQLLDQYTDHTFVHTGQNYDPTLNDNLYSDLCLRRPDMSGDGTTIPTILKFVDDVMEEVKPDRLLILGDTNSGLSALMAKRRGITVYHMEAGNRCYDDSVPEELNRRIIDHASDVLLPYTENSRRNLLLEGIRPNRIFVTGNPIHEVIKTRVSPLIVPSLIANGTVKEHEYLLVTLHRSETVDHLDRLYTMIGTLSAVQDTLKTPIVLSVHPHLRKQVQKHGIDLDKMFITREPFGFREFIHLERSAMCVLTDSGTVQEECSIMNVPCVTLRDVTERPEILEAGGGIIAGSKQTDIVRAIRIAVNQLRPGYVTPIEYHKPNVSDVVVRIVTGVVPK